jgi:hypothetical protein
MLDMVEDNPDVAVELSKHIPRLLAIAAEESARIFDGSQAHAMGGGYTPWQESVHQVLSIINALWDVSRLPQQEVFDSYALTAAAGVCSSAGLGWSPPCAGVWCIMPVQLLVQVNIDMCVCISICSSGSGLPEQSVSADRRTSNPAAILVPTMHTPQVHPTVHVPVLTTGEGGLGVCTLNMVQG